jgi:parallel beta-helix repeat protein
LFIPHAISDVGAKSIFIRTDGSIDPSSVPITRDGNTYTLTADLYDKTIIVEKDNITINGNGHHLLGSSTPYSTAVNISEREGVTVKNLKITSYYYGMSIEFSSYNTLIGNTISDDNIVIYAEGSTDNLIFHNNFITEPNRKYGGANSWDNGIEGNYWSGDQNEDFYSGRSQNITGSDGIGDNSYIVDEDNLDSYPLMGPYHSFSVEKQGGTQYLYAISDSNVTSLTYDLSHKIILQVSNNSENLEFCRLDIPKALLAPPYTVLVDDGQTPIAYYNDNLADNGTDRWIYFSYQHSNHLVTIVSTEKLPGDVNQDGKVSLSDLVLLALAYGSKPGDSNWNLNADIDSNGAVGLSDLVILAQHYGQHYP